MSDVCEIGRLMDCVSAGEHVRLDLDGTGDTTTGMNFAGVRFGAMNFCKRCGLFYWEPLAPVAPTAAEGDGT